MDIQKMQALGSMTQEADAANPDPATQAAQAEEQAAQAEADTGAKAWGMVMFAMGGFAQMIAPELKPVYTEERCYAWGQKAQAVAEKYGWGGPTAMPEIALIASTAGFFVPTYLVVKAKVEQAKQAKDGTLAEKLAAWWQNRKAQKAAQREAAGEVVTEAAEVRASGQ